MRITYFAKSFFAEKTPGRTLNSITSGDADKEVMGRGGSPSEAPLEHSLGKHSWKALLENDHGKLSWE